jgi:zona occludens toxin
VITLITGAPGAGKSAALVDLLTSEAKRRAIYADGIPDLKLPHVALDEPRKWMDFVEDGAAVVIDEVQRVWRPRGNGAAVPVDVAALETHRHRGLDFYLVTQHPNLLDANVRRLVGRHVHLRDVGLLGRMWYEWPEATNPETFRNAPIKKRYTLPKSVFGLYKSASIHVKPVRSVPRAVFVLAAAALALCGLAYRAYASITDKLEPQAPPAAVAQQNGQHATGAAMAEPAASAAHVSTVTPGRPRVVGCFSSASSCRCFDKEGFPVTIDWDLCKVSASSYAGLVPLSVDPPPRVTPLEGAGVEPQESPKGGSQQTMAGL